MSKNLPNASAELDRAAESVRKMEESADFKSFNDNWRDALTYMEKARLKVAVECQVVPLNQWTPFEGKAKNKRQKDPLLKYIDQARDADQHSIQEILVKKDSHYSVKGIISNDQFSEDFEITTKEPGNVVINGKVVGMQPVGTSFRAIAVTNRKVVTPPPLAHAGKFLRNTFDPVEIATLGIAYYREFFQEIEKKFF